jgi:hypothetical protein
MILLKKDEIFGGILDAILLSGLNKFESNLPIRDREKSYKSSNN